MGLQVRYNTCVYTPISFPYAPSIGARFCVPCGNQYQIARRDTFCPHGRTYLMVLRTISVQLCPHGSVHYRVNDNLC